ncbi:Rubisco methyltransferase family protein, putative [Theobroma cacao]|uniref:Rubisco methyltransferase family protein, putative n=1 Tax=Theobroma cacao TaxID=3641 RepID=A0A061DM85_THECC|nr:Rubisco methyltransferase family protein, putative [Theobroma cacao]
MQVFISYGKKSNGELLLSYGFAPKEGTNPSDSVELPLSLKKSDKCYKEKLEALRKHGLSASQCYPIQITGWPLELMAYAYLAMAAAASNKSITKKDLRYPEIEEKARQFILDSCESSISKYSKFLQACGSMDLDVTSPKQLNRRVFMKQLAVDLCTKVRAVKEAMMIFAVSRSNDGHKLVIESDSKIIDFDVKLAHFANQEQHAKDDIKVGGSSLQHPIRTALDRGSD